MAKGEQGKISKAEAGYTPLSENVETQCQNCSMFVEPGSCTLVEGKINPLGHCRHFDPKEKPSKAPSRRKPTSGQTGTPGLAPSY